MMGTFVTHFTYSVAAVCTMHQMRHCSMGLMRVLCYVLPSIKLDLNAKLEAKLETFKAECLNVSRGPLCISADLPEAVEWVTNTTSH